MAGFINKPYRPNDLVSAVQDALHPPAVSPPMDVDACTHADGFLEDGARRCACTAESTATRTTASTARRGRMDHMKLKYYILLLNT